MNLIVLLNLKSKEDRVKEKETFEASIFPLGIEEKKKVEEYIKLLFKTKKLDTKDLLYNYIVLKQAIITNNSLNDYSRWYYSATSKYLKKEEKCLMKALVMAFNNISNLSELISIEQIRENSLDYLNEEAPKKIK